jgi:4'-phosphopantetheinyl transferase
VTLMPNADSDASPDDFTRECMHALARCGFVAPGIGEACILVCDSALWASHAASAEHVLDAGERARAARFQFERDRITYVTSHALWRTAIGFCLGVEAALVRLSSTSTGQPRLYGTGYATSLSHSGTWVAMAICAGTTIGVDIERSPTRLAMDALMPLVCTPAEISVMEKLSPPERETTLLALWTRKEALLKAFGVGLTADPAQLSATSGELVAPPALATDQVPCRACPIEALPNNLAGALAVPASIVTTRLYRLEKTE